MTIVALSDTHYTNHKLDKLTIPDGDVIIHAGDATFKGEVDEYRKFHRWWASQQPRFKHSVYMPGNHDFGAESTTRVMEIDGVWFGFMSLVPNLPEWAFHATEGEIASYLRHLEGVDVLVTHGPPQGIRDADIYTGERYGSRALLNYISSSHRPKVHIFGHVHEGYGYESYLGVDCFNVSICDREYNLTNPVTVIEL